ncbi:pyridoxal phosphate-dependent aminotransferase [Pseudorhodobacter sp. W20_MBD10_FR17]|uniref:pyridoxal phosphate-dependent aminotransferase n=1 Tax=Pseudorhodobacter sp. W20_MBD10_FR17 TaxID=3240266 RepID=UPI003F9D54F4
MPQLNSALTRLKPSAISDVFDRAAQLRANGQKLFDFSVGEPDFDTPAAICEAGIKAINDGKTRYTAVDGTPELKQAIAAKFRRDNGLDFALDQIVVASGAKPLLAVAIQAVAGPGDEVILPTPCWTSHVGMIDLCGAEAKLVECGMDSGFKITPNQLRAVLTAKTRLLLLCSPSNPTGAVYSADELAALGKVLADFPGVWVLSDDLYEHIVFAPNIFATLAEVAPELRDRILTVNGVSKSYAMTGWRIGYAAGPTQWVNAIRKVFSQSNGGPCSISQAASVEALNGPQDFLETWRATYQRRRDLAVSILAQAPGLELATPEGAFYIFPNCAKLLGKETPQGRKIETSSDFCTLLLEQHNVVTVPGAGFFCDPYFRISIATSEDVIQDGCQRIVDAINTLRTAHCVKN